MALPQAIERAEAEAEAIRVAAYEAPPPAAPADPEATAVEPAQPAAPPAVPPAEPLRSAEPARVASPPVGDANDAAYWRQRFDTVQGKYDAEMPRLFQQLREQGETIKVLSTKLATQETPPAAPADELVSQQDIDSFGENLCGFIQRVAEVTAQKVFAAERASFDARVGSVTQRVEQVQTHMAQTTEDSFWKEVIRLVPDWPVIDASPSWIQFLNTSPDYTELTYRELAGQAIAKGKPEKIAKLVNAWKKETGYVTPQPAAAPAAPAIPAAPAAPAAPDLSSQVAPSTVRSSSAPVARKILSRVEYQNLYDVRNVQKFGAKKAAEMIAEADLAVAENRVQWT